MTQPGLFRAYLLEQLQPLAADYRPVIEVSPSQQEIPYPYVLERGDELRRGHPSAAEPGTALPEPLLAVSATRSPTASGRRGPGRPQPLALFDAVRVDYSLRRLVHYTGTDWRHVQPWILLTNYHRYVDQFVRWGLAELTRRTAPMTARAAGRLDVVRGETASRGRAIAAAALAPLPDAGLPPVRARRQAA